MQALSRLRYAVINRRDFNVNKKLQNLQFLQAWTARSDSVAIGQGDD
jgi:hypothetical protein